MKLGKTDWIVAEGEGTLCQRCGETEKIPVPIPIPAFVKWAKYFIEKHRYCKETAK
jgi:rRNA maturation protein Nop10